jgi:translocation protein SEC63
MSFKDTFTKEDKEGLLGYDDTAFYYFASSVVLVVAVPWTISAIYNLIFPGEAQIQQDFPKKSKVGSTFKYCQSAEMREKIEVARREARKFNVGSCMGFCKFGTIAFLWILLYVFTLQMGQETEIKRFDPFKILGVEVGANASQIKKAYRELSKIYHPDKNPDDPLAQARFIEITKANTALTDEGAKANYEKYGNPDGPQTSKVGVGLPSFLLEKDNHLMILCAFFFLLLILVPATFICYYQRTKSYAQNGVMIETMQFMGYYITDATRVKNCPELLAASLESRSMPGRASDNNDMKPVMKEVLEHAKRKYQAPIIIKNSVLIWAHMQRRHEFMSPELRQDCDQLLKYSMKITQAMIEIACMWEWFFTAQAMIEFRRSLVQALDVKSSQLLQIPHFNEESLKHAQRGKNSVSTLTDFISKAPEERKGLANMQPQELADIEAFIQHVSDMEVTAKVEVEDEQSMVVFDVATVTITMVRKNLQDNEAIGPVHAPLFPEPKFEEWWLFLVEGGSATTRIIASQRIRNTEKEVEEKMRFQLSRPGKHQLVLHAMCDSYAGLDKKVELNFNVSTEDEVKREVFVHPEDEELDLQPTLFQQFMGDFNQEEEESEEEEEDKDKADKGSKAARKAPAARGKKVDLGESAAKAEDEDSDSDSEPEKEDEKGKSGGAGKKKGKDDSSDSSSDSD